MSTRMKMPGPHEPKKHSSLTADAARELRKFRTYMNKAQDTAALATAYINDGALLSGAQSLREAADLLQRAHETRTKALGAPLN